MTTKLKISADFSDTPGPRYKSEGSHSGEEFRTSMLSNKVRDAIQNGDTLVVDLDGAQGYGTSFLEESFGGLIRDDKLDYDDIINHVDIISNEEPYLKEDINGYLKDASNEAEG